MNTNYEAERSVLACCLIGDKKATEGIVEQLMPEHFTGEYSIIFSAIRSLHSLCRDVDLVSVASYLELTRNLFAIGGIDVLAELTHIIPNAGNYQTYINIVLDMYKLKQTKLFAQTVLADVEGGKIRDTDVYLAELHSRIPQPKVSTEVKTWSDSCHIVADRIDAYYVDDHHNKGVFPTGIVPLDVHFGGGIPSKAIIVASRPSLGKTELGIEIMLGIAQNGGKVWLNQFEETIEDIEQRLLCKIMNTSVEKLRLGLVDRDLVEWAFNERAKLHIDLSATPMIADRFATILKNSKVKYDGVLIDQFDKIQSPYGVRDERKAKEYNSERIYSAIRDAGICGVLLAQINRQGDNRQRTDGGDLSLGDLAETSRLEKDFDIVLLMSRPNLGTDNDYLKIQVAKDRFMQRVGNIWKLAKIDGRLVGVE